MNNLLNKYVWLVETIYKAKRIKFFTRSDFSVSVIFKI